MIPAKGIVAMTPRRFRATVLFLELFLELFLDLRWYFASTRWGRVGSAPARVGRRIKVIPPLDATTVDLPFPAGDSKALLRLLSKAASPFAPHPSRAPDTRL